MSGAIIIVIFASATGLIGLMSRRIKYGSACCGEATATEKKIPARDKNRKHYPYAYVVKIDGMRCANCARRVENAFHAQPEVLAKVDLGEKLANIYSKRPISRNDALRYLQGTSYTLLDFYEEDET